MLLDLVYVLETEKSTANKCFGAKLKLLSNSTLRNQKYSLSIRCNLDNTFPRKHFNSFGTTLLR